MYISKKCLKLPILYGIILGERIIIEIYEKKGEIIMNKSKLIKTILVIMLGMMLIFSTSVFAADDDISLDALFGDEDDTETSTSTDEDTSTILTDNNQPSSTRAQNTSVPSTSDNTLTVENVTTTKNDNNTTGNTSVYDNNTTNNTNTPETISKAGIEDSIPMVLIVVLAISAVYAYKKNNEYKNI